MSYLLQNPEFVEKLSEAIPVRTSVRKYLSDNVEQPIINQIIEATEFINAHMQKLGSHARVLFLHENVSRDSLTGFFGFRHDSTGLLVVFVGSKLDGKMADAYLGYASELFILAVEGFGVCTCYNGAMHSPEAVVDSINANNIPYDSEKDYFLCVTSLGYPRERKTFGERLMSGVVGSRKRKPIENRLVESFDVEIPENIQKLLDAAIASPSAVNKQPWRVKLSSDFKTFGIYYAEYREWGMHDAAIFFSHFVIALEQAGIPFEVDHIVDEEPINGFYPIYRVTLQ
ncbi:hypothetical protein PCE1_001626 [Barthelona sp. PCE]